MKINSKIFKSYDIRGVYPSELNEEVAYKVGRAFVLMTGAKKVAVGQDARLSSPTLSKNLIKGITEAGADAYDMGLAMTECVYFSVGKYDYDGGIMVTASHNPKNYNGFKMIRRNGSTIDVISGEKIKEWTEKDSLEKAEEGTVNKIDIRADLLNHIFSFIDTEKIKPLKIVIDTGHGAAGPFLDLVLSGLPIKAFPLGFEPDGSFPARSPNPLEKGALNNLKKEISEQQADAGLIFDGDGDRVFLVDEKGDLIKGDTALLLLAKHLLQKDPGKGVSFNVICSKAVPELVEEWGGKPVKTKVGYINVREGMIKNEGIVGGEVSGHFSFRDNYYFDSGLIAFLIFLEIISEENKKVSEIVAPLTPYFRSDENNFEVEDKEKVLQSIKKEYPGLHQSEMDGLTVDYEDWWFNVRPSQTEPLLRLVVETESKELTEEKVKEISLLIQNLN